MSYTEKYINKKRNAYKAMKKFSGQGYQPVEQGNIYIKNFPDELLQQLSDGRVYKLGPDFNTYFKLSPTVKTGSKDLSERTPYKETVYNLMKKAATPTLVEIDDIITILAKTQNQLPESNELSRRLRKLKVEGQICYDMFKRLQPGMHDRDLDSEEFRRCEGLDHVYLGQWLDSVKLKIERKLDTARQLSSSTSRFEVDEYGSPSKMRVSIKEEVMTHEKKTPTRFRKIGFTAISTNEFSPGEPQVDPQAVEDRFLEMSGVFARGVKGLIEASSATSESDIEALIRNLMELSAELKKSYNGREAKYKDVGAKVNNFEDKVIKTRELLDQSMYFNPEDKPAVLKGLHGIIIRACNEIVDCLRELGLTNVEIASPAKEGGNGGKAGPADESQGPGAEEQDDELQSKVQIQNLLINHNSNPSVEDKAEEQDTTTVQKQFESFSAENESHRLRTTSEKEVLHISIGEGEGRVTVVKMVDNEQVAVGFTSGDLIFFNLDKLEPDYGHREHQSSITTIEVASISMLNKDGSRVLRRVLLTGGSDEECSILVWDLESNLPMKRLSGHSHLISSIIDLGDSSTIVVGSFDSKISFWDLSEQFSCIQLLADTKSPILTMEYEGEVKDMLVGCMDGSLLVYRITFKEGVYHGCFLTTRLMLSGHILDICTVPALPETVLVLESDFVVRLYNKANGRMLRGYSSESPFVDFFLVDKGPKNMPDLFCLDNRGGVHHFNRWSYDQEVHRSPVSRGGERQPVKLKQFFGYRPKSQIVIRGKSLFLLTPDQMKKGLILQEIEMS